MKNRFFIFLTMLLTVIVVGTGATMLNLRLQQKTAEEAQVNFALMMDRDQSSPETAAGIIETQASALYDSARIAEGESAVNELSAVMESETIPSDVEMDAEQEVKQELPQELQQESQQAPKQDLVEQVVQNNRGNEKESYYARLQDMERAYTARMNASAKESLTTQQKTADELLEIWDDELNAIYQKLRASMKENDFQVLRSEERAWIRNRDAAANKAAAGENYSKSAQNLAYTRSLLQWTKERVYELAAMYYRE